MAFRDPLFTSMEDSFGYGFDNAPRMRPTPAMYYDYDPTGRRYMNVSPPNGPLERPRMFRPGCWPNYDDVSPLGSEYGGDSFNPYPPRPGGWPRYNVGPMGGDRPLRPHTFYEGKYNFSDCICLSSTIL